MSSVTPSQSRLAITSAANESGIPRNTLRATPPAAHTFRILFSRILAILSAFVHTADHTDPSAREKPRANRRGR